VPSHGSSHDAAPNDETTVNQAPRLIGACSSVSDFLTLSRIARQRLSWKTLGISRFRELARALLH
jgi:hypothetical protein